MARSDIESVIMWGRNTISGRKQWPAARTNKLERCGPSGTRGLRCCVTWPCAKEPTAAACKRPEPGLVQRASGSSTRSSTGAARQTNRDGSPLPDRILHIEVARGLYSKPAELVGQRVQVRADSRLVKGDRRLSDRSLQEPSSGVLAAILTFPHTFSTLDPPTIWTLPSPASTSVASLYHPLPGPDLTSNVVT
jgi:hypothetical protein